MVPPIHEVLAVDKRQKYLISSFLSLLGIMQGGILRKTHGLDEGYLRCL